MLVTKGDRLECEDRFARFVHWLDVVLKACRGNDRAELPVGVYDYSDASGYRGPADASDKRGVLNPLLADTDCLGLARQTRIADIDIVVAWREIATGVIANRDVVIAGGVLLERRSPAGSILNPRGI